MHMKKITVLQKMPFIPKVLYRPNPSNLCETSLLSNKQVNKKLP